LSQDVDIKELSMNFELTGGLIKNAILSALSNAIARNGESIELTKEDLVKGARLQLRGHLQMNEFDRRVVPTKGLADLILKENIEKILKEIVNYSKAAKVLYAHWGFDDKIQRGSIVIFHGDRGNGKTSAAQALGYELGKPLKEINTGEIFSRYVGGSSKQMESIFKEAREMDAILVLAEAEVIFGHKVYRSSQYSNELTSLLYHMERFPGIIILISTKLENIDLSLFNSLKFILEFSRPDKDMRKKIMEEIITNENTNRRQFRFRKACFF